MEQIDFKQENIGLEGIEFIKSNKCKQNKSSLSLSINQALKNANLNTEDKIIEQESL